jgi:hypothetical protein
MREPRRACPPVAALDPLRLFGRGRNHEHGWVSLGRRRPREGGRWQIRGYRDRRWARDGCGHGDGRRRCNTGGARGAHRGRRRFDPRSGAPGSVPRSSRFSTGLGFSWPQGLRFEYRQRERRVPRLHRPELRRQELAYFGLHREATSAKEPAIFVAPGDISNVPPENRQLSSMHKFACTSASRLAWKFIAQF